MDMEKVGVMNVLDERRICFVTVTIVSNKFMIIVKGGQEEKQTDIKKQKTLSHIVCG